MSIVQPREPDADNPWVPKVYEPDLLGTEAIHKRIIKDFDIAASLKQARTNGLTEMPPSSASFEVRIKWYVDFRRHCDVSYLHRVAHGPSQDDADFATFYDANGNGQQQKAHEALILITSLLVASLRLWGTATIQAFIMTATATSAVELIELVESELGLDKETILLYAKELLNQSWVEDSSISFEEMYKKYLNAITLGATLQDQWWERRDRTVAAGNEFGITKTSLTTAEQFVLSLPTVHFTEADRDALNTGGETYAKRLTMFRQAASKIARAYARDPTPRYQGTTDTTYAVVAGANRKSPTYPGTAIAIGFGGYSSVGKVYTSKDQLVKCPNTSNGQVCNANHYKNFPNCPGFDQAQIGRSSGTHAHKKAKLQTPKSKTNGNCRYGTTCRNISTCRFRHDTVAAVATPVDMTAMVATAVQAAMHNATVCPCLEHKSGAGTDKATCSRYQAYMQMPFVNNTDV